MKRVENPKLLFHSIIGIAHTHTRSFFQGQKRGSVLERKRESVCRETGKKVLPENNEEGFSDREKTVLLYN